ncbi:MAG: methyltransferase domain-containing protein [Hyphomicrobiales bacterium]|nr:methyltransferase domain-containing protein [Hyphomicrobiales bacterium]
MADKAHVERAIAACYATWADDYYDNYYGPAAAYPPVHADLVLRTLLEGGARCLLDAGCGPASFLRHMAHAPIAWHGFDLTPEMVARARALAAEIGRGDAEIWVGSVLDDGAFRPPGRDIAFDSAILIGVLPHIPAEEDEQVLHRLAGAVTPGGLLIAEARNALFGLFTLNRPSFELFAERLVDWPALAAAASDAERAALDGLREALAARFRMDLPPVRTGKAGEPGYDQVLSRAHVPFELAEAARRAGWIDVEILYTHFHALPPMFERVVPDLFRRASLAMENPRDWRGMVMASSFHLVGRRQG